MILMEENFSVWKYNVVASAQRRRHFPTLPTGVYELCGENVGHVTTHTADTQTSVVVVSFEL